MADVKVGQVVAFSEPGLETGNNGATWAPAVVVRVHSPTCVNVRVLCDGPDVLWRTSANHKSVTGASMQWWELP